MSEITAVLGLGIIGARCANQLLQSNWNVRTWNRTPKDRLDSTPSPREAVKDANFIALYLKDGTAVREVFSHIKDILTSDQTLLNHSTVDLETTRWLADQCQQIGCRFLDAPFTGSKDAATNGALVYYIGGDASTLENSRPILEATSKEIKHLGPVGSATVIKLATNLISASTVQALSEALAITTANGISAEVLTDAVASNACGSPLAAMKLPTMAQGDFDTHFSLENMLKDSRFAIQLAHDAGLTTPGIQATSDAMADGCKKGNAHLDFSCLFKTYPPQTTL